MLHARNCQSSRLMSQQTGPQPILREPAPQTSPHCRFFWWSYFTSFSAENALARSESSNLLTRHIIKLPSRNRAFFSFNFQRQILSLIKKEESMYVRERLRSQWSYSPQIWHDSGPRVSIGGSQLPRPPPLLMLSCKGGCMYIRVDRLLPRGRHMLEERSRNRICVY